jgi:hypothetical protein
MMVIILFDWNYSIFPMNYSMITLKSSSKIGSAEVVDVI